MHARRGIVPIFILGAYAYLSCAPRAPGPRSVVEQDMPHAEYTLAVADAPKSIAELRRRIEAILERDHLPGITIALVGRDGPIWVGGIGERDQETHAPMEANTAFRVGSLSKTIVALAVMRLADQGRLDIDRPLRELLPDAGIVNPWEDVAPVTLAQCLEHTAGFDDIRFNEIYTDDEWISVRDTLRLNPRSRVVRWRPGTRHSYSNVGYTLAARAVEVASGEPFDTYVRREILAPLGIVDAAFGRTPDLASRLATGYLDGGRRAPFHPLAHRPSASLLMSAEDLAKLVHFWIRRGDGYPPIVSKAGLDRIERSGTLPYPHLATDYGFANYGDVAHPVFSRGHDGGMPGFHASIRYFPTLGVGYAMLLNNDYAFRGYFRIRSLLYAYLTRDRAEAGVRSADLADRAASGVADGDTADRPGADYFALANPRHELFGFLDRAIIGWLVGETASGLHVTELGGATYELVPAGDGGYRTRHECGSSVRFTTNRDGTPIMLTSFMYGEAAVAWVTQLRYLALWLTVALLMAAPLWAVGVLGYSALSRRLVVPASLVVWPAIAGLCFFAIPRVLFAAFHAGVIGQVHPLTVGLCALTILFAVASTATAVQTLRWLPRPDRPPLVSLVIPTVFGVAFFSLTVWLGAHGWIGLRTWAW